MNGAVVLLSGGIDSTVALALTLQTTRYVETLTVSYGQTHNKEIGAAHTIADHYQVGNTTITLDPILFAGSALTGFGGIPDNHADNPDTTYVPARNTVLLALAAARAETLHMGRVVIGCNKDDAAGYPDCRRNYLEAFRDVLAQGTINNTWVSAPLLELTKPSIIKLAHHLNVPTHLTWSCYRGGDTPCGQCGACQVMP